MQVRRGADRADIYSLAFSSNVKWLAASSDKGTVHVFNIKFDSPSLGNTSTLMSQPNLSNKSSPISMLSTLPLLKGINLSLHVIGIVVLCSSHLLLFSYIR